MKDVAIPQTLIQVDRDILKYCRTYSIGEIITSRSVCTNEHLYKAASGRVCLHLESCEFNLYATVLRCISLTFFYTDLCFLYKANL